MNKHTFRNDILGLLKARGITLRRLALESGVETSSLWRFVNNEKANLNTDSVFKIWPFIYGDRDLTPLPTTTPSSSAEQDAPHE